MKCSRKVSDFTKVKQAIFQGGLSGNDFSKVVNEDGTAYVLKNLSHSKNKDSEIYATKIASENGYGPQIHYYDTTNDTIIMSLLSGNPQTGKLNNVQMSEIVCTLRKMHNGPAVCKNMVVIDQIQTLYNGIDYYPAGIKKQQILRVIDEISAFNRCDKKPTHIDLHDGNIFFTDTGCKFIDFEYAR